MMKIIEREIAVYDNKTELYLYSIPINSVSVNEIIPLISIDINQDPLVYNCYFLDAKALTFLSQKIKELEGFDLEKYSYSYETTELQSYRQQRNFHTS